MKPLGWLQIVRLGLVQSSLGAIVMVATSILNRVMVVEYALPAMLPAALVGWHYAVQLSRTRWGYGSDVGGRRTPWIIGGMGVLALGMLIATNAAMLTASDPVLGIGLGVVAFTLIGIGVGASGTSLLALLATRTAPARRPAAAALTWIMMIAGIVVTAGIAGSLLDPFSPQRLAMVAGGVALAAFSVTLLAVAGVEGRAIAVPRDADQPFAEVMRGIWDDTAARRLTIFIFVSMLAYSAQDMILEPFAGLVFAYTPGQSTQLTGVQHMGVLIGMVLVGAAGARLPGGLRPWIVGGCIGSAVALAGLAAAAIAGPGFPLRPFVFALGFANGVFAVAAIGSMMAMAGGGAGGREGARMGVWGAAQAIAFGLGGFGGAAALDAGRAFVSDAAAFQLVFTAEAGLFVLAALLALGLSRKASDAVTNAPVAARA